MWTQTEYDMQGQVTAVTTDPKRSPAWVSGLDDNPNGLAIRTTAGRPLIDHVQLVEAVAVELRDLARPNIAHGTCLHRRDPAADRHAR